MRSSRVTLVHGNREEATERAAKLGNVDVDIVCDGASAAGLLKDLRRHPPAAIVIDLSRIPSQGRDLALALRESKATRAIPVVFAEGEPTKVARIRELLPDATYASWRGLRGAGLVDFRIASIDATWSGLRFTVAKATPTTRRK